MILHELVECVDARRPVVLATVVATSRSVPRRAGSKMLVYADGATSGSVGGGEMEARVLSEAADALADGRTRRLTYSLVDPSSGDPGVCGGEVEIYLEPHMPTPTLFIVGAGHVGKAVAELASWLDLRVVVWDDRDGVVESLELDGAKVDVLTGPIADAVEAAAVDEFTQVAMVTRNVALDVEILPVLLATDAAYIGLMGSERRWSTTRTKLAEMGIAGDQLERVTAPIGVEIHAETPGEIAVSILAQVIAGVRAAA